MRGDRPSVHWANLLSVGFTPHARGSTVVVIEAGLDYMVYPACAGIDPLVAQVDVGACGLPRMRGDRPLCFTLPA